MKKWILIVLMVLAMPATAGMTAMAPLGQVVTEKNNPEAMFKKWRSMLARDSAAGDCTVALTQQCLPSDVMGFVQSVQGLSAAEQLQKVNSFVNRVRYRSDKSLYGTGDYWASPLEFFAKNKGDCEDFGIAKYSVLMALGFESDSMRLIIAKDIKVRDFHAVLAVSMGGQDYILDNRTNRLLVANKQTNLKPIYALNNEHWWLYAGAKDLLKG